MRYWIEHMMDLQTVLYTTLTITYLLTACYDIWLFSAVSGNQYIMITIHCKVFTFYHILINKPRWERTQNYAFQFSSGSPVTTVHMMKYFTIQGSCVV